MSSADSYDELGRLRTKKRHGGADTETYAYNIRNWTTQIKSGSFTEKLYYNTNPLNARPCYNGNISYSTWTYNNGSTTAEKGYAYEYDELNRLVNAEYQQGSSSQATGSFNEQFTYDKMGNILTLQRKKDNALIDNLTYNYKNNNGSNQLNYITDAAGTRGLSTIKEYQGLSAATAGEFQYDANGNLIKDADREIVRIKYNLLNLPDTVVFANGNLIINRYDAGGRKLLSRYLTKVEEALLPVLIPKKTLEKPSEIIGDDFETIDEDLGVPDKIITLDIKTFEGYETNYAENFEYESTVNIYTDRTETTTQTLTRLHTPEGYITTVSSPQYHYYRRDHLGNNREVWLANTNTTLQRTQYYPSGLPWAESVGASAQNRKYNGKEFVEMHGWDEYDSEARWMYPAIMRTSTLDPLAEKYYSISPYAWCDNNHVNVIDPDGMDYWSTNDPAEIERFMNSVRNGSAYYNASNWTHVSDKDFTANLTYNDETFKFYTSFSYYDKKGILTCEGVSFTNTMNFLNERELNPLEKWSNSDNFFANYAYNTLNDLFVTLQPLIEPFIGTIRVNELTGGKAFVNIDGTTNYNAIESASSTLSGIIQPTNVVKGLGTLSKLNASQFSKTFKGTLSRFNPSFRGFLNRRINKLIDSWNTSVPTGKIVVDGAEISSEINNK